METIIARLFGVSDHKRSVAFYTDVMGWEVRSDNGTNQATLDW